MNPHDQHRSSIGPSANRTPEIEVGVIDDVDREEGTCTVITERGREVQVRIATPMAGLGGTGLSITPRRGSKCMVVLFVSGETGMVRPEDGYLISTFQAEEGDTEEWGAPGDVHLTTEGGGKMLFTQSGVVDVQSDPWARQSFLPKEKTIKQWDKNHERLHTPLAHDRTIHDGEAEVAFREMAINSRFLHRENDSVPDVYRAIGSAQGSEKASGHHPQSGALSFYRVEQRSEQGEPQERLTRLEGAQEREILREEFEDLRDGNSLVRSIGIDGATFRRERLSHGEATRDLKVGKGINTAGEVKREQIEFEDTSLLFKKGHFGETLTEAQLTVGGDKVLTKEVFEDGRVLAENPTWTVDIGAENKMTVSNDETTITVEDDTVTIENGWGLGGRKSDAVVKNRALNGTRICPSWDKLLRSGSCNEKTVRFVRHPRSRGSPSAQKAPGFLGLGPRVRCRGSPHPPATRMRSDAPAPRQINRLQSAVGEKAEDLGIPTELEVGWPDTEN